MVTLSHTEVSILVVDDDPDILRGTTRILDRAGYATATADSGEAALQVMNLQKPNLVLLDWDMPGMDGIEVCKWIKGNPAFNESLVIMISAIHTESEEQAAGLESGADGYISRPISNRELVARVESFARIWGLHHSLRESEARVRSMLHATPIGLGMSLDRVFTEVNEAVVRMTGYRRDELIGQSERLLFASDAEFEGVGKNQDVQILEQGIGAQETHWQHKNAELRDIYLSTAPTDPAKRDKERTFSAQDITRRKQKEESLRIAATAFEVQQGMVVTDLQGNILKVNQAYTTITGYSAEDLVGKNPRLLQSGRHDAAFYRAMWRGAASGQWQGEIWNKHKSGDIYPAWLSISAVADGAGVITHYVGACSNIAERKAAEQRIETLAFYDVLTGLPNRALLRDRLQHVLAGSLRSQRQAALLHIDLDNFKNINDTLGHDQGDRIIEEVAKRLRTCTSASDTLARIGGDEFILLLADPFQVHQDSVVQAAEVAEKVLDALRQPFVLGQSIQHSSVSIGIALFGGGKSDSVEKPLKQAELAMYQAKAAGRNTLRFFDPQMEAVASARANLESQLREGLVQSQFVLHFQPQVDETGQVTGSEALVRWLNPERGVVSPGEFIPVAEQSGLILPLGQWVLERACTELARWASVPAMAHLTLAVNISARQFHQNTFVEHVLDALKRTGANPKRLKIELTESMVVDDIEGVIAKMGALKGYGVNFSLDDFGTGYSSLAYLKRLPLSQLKIDQGFVRNILVDANDAAIAKMVIALAQSMGLAVIAEGVETVGQRDFLANAGCPAFQGYLYSKPLALDEFEAFVMGV